MIGVGSMGIKLIYHVNPNGFDWIGCREIEDGDIIPDGWTDVEPPTYSTYKLIFDWETNEWIETATEWEKLGYTTEEEMIAGEQKKQLEASLPDDKARITQLEEMVMQLLLMS